MRITNMVEAEQFIARVKARIQARGMICNDDIDEVIDISVCVERCHHRFSERPDEWPAQVKVGTLVVDDDEEVDPDEWADELMKDVGCPQCDQPPTAPTE
jgi:hypothetical protein